ncbi:MAG TPA: pyruvate dehydrogenase (acetyl-transferring) E1 component subunit alpha [Anaerolineae bacterium]|nr:pyruvate dehydrogenase (acetyl-transferring) E1 component subunit alpha [Anaerolineae bacterium]
MATTKTSTAPVRDKKSTNGRANGEADRSTEGSVVDTTTLKSWYREMVLIREFEERARQSYQQGKIGGFLHLYIGEEAVAVGAIHALKPQDHIVTHYRDHGHAIARGLDPKKLMAELYGRVDGTAHGRGGSMHFADTSKNFWGGYAIVGGHLTIAVGLAIAAQRAKEDRVALAIFGDGSTDAGQFYECLNLAAVWKLPVVFLCENNQYGMGVAIQKASAVTEVYKKASMANIPAVQVDGMDVVKVHEVMKQVIEEVRNGGGPRFVEALTFRYQGHSVADPDKYRAKEEIDKWKKRDAIEHVRALLIDKHSVKADELAAVDADVQHEMDEVVKFADASAAPDVSTIYDYIYAQPV